MALEPYARRMWPKTMISWVRLLNGRFRDPLVGRDILAGSIGGMVVGFGAPIYKLAPGWLGYALPRPDRPSPDPGELVSILGLREALSQLFLKHANVLVTALFVLAALVVLRLVLRKPWLALVAWALLIVLVSHPTGGYMGWALGLWSS